MIRPVTRAGAQPADVCDTPAMTRWPIVRAALAAGLAAVSAAFAHAGPAGITTPSWLAVSAAGATVAAVALSIAGARTLRTADQLRRLRSGVLAGSAPGQVVPVPFTVLVAAMLACQGGAHLGLLLAGVHAGSGMGGAIALHCALALASAALLRGVELTVARLTDRLEHAIAAAVAALRCARPAPVPSPHPRPRTRRPAGAIRGRAPPLPA